MITYHLSFPRRERLMTENKTKATKGSVTAFLNTIKEKERREDCFEILEMMRKVTHIDPIMWGSAIVGFGTYHYVYESGREGDNIILGFSPRKKNISIYLVGGADHVEAELANLGKYARGKGCLYINSLGEVKKGVLEKIFAKSYKESKLLYAKSK
jgi:hypothetical protein